MKKKTLKKTVLLFLFLPLVGITAPHDDLGAALVDFFSIPSNTQDLKTEFYEGKRNGVRFGRFETRFPIQNLNLISITPPTFSAGCGGISMNLGAISIVDSEDITNFLQAVGPNMVGYIAQIALSELCPNCAEKLSDVLNTIREFSSMSLNSCEVAKDLVNAGRGAMCQGFIANDVSSGGSQDNYTARTLCDSRATISDIDEEDVAIKLSSNPVFYAMRKNQTVPQKEPNAGDSEDIRKLALAEMVMSIGGITRNGLKAEDTVNVIPHLRQKEAEYLFNTIICGDANQWGSSPSSQTTLITHSSSNTTINLSQINILDTAKLWCDTVSKNQTSPNDLKVVSCVFDSADVNQGYSYENCGLNDDTTSEIMKKRNGDRNPNTTLTSHIPFVKTVSLSNDDASYMNKAFIKNNQPYLYQIAKEFSDFLIESQDGGQDPTRYPLLMSIVSDSQVPLYKVINMASEYPQIAQRFFAIYLPYIATMSFYKLYINTNNFALKGVPKTVSNAINLFSEMAKRTANQRVTALMNEFQLMNTMANEIRQLEQYQISRALTASSWLKGTIF